MMERIFPVRGYILFIKAKQHKFFHVDTKKRGEAKCFPSKGIIKFNSNYFTTNF